METRRDQTSPLDRDGGARHQVIVVGGGPVGHGLAIELGRRGIDCALVEPRLTPQPIPKGQNLTHRSLEHFAAWGCEPELRARRVLPAGYPIGGIVAYGDLTSDYWHAPAGREAVGPYYSQRNERLPQYETEAVLRGRAAALDGVTTHYGWTATAVSPDDDGVEVRISAGTGEERRLRASYVVGCDGARSKVRQQAGIGQSASSLSRRMLLAVLRSRELHDGLARFPERTTYRVVHPELDGFWRFFGRVDVGEGWFFHAPVAEDAELASFDAIAALHAAAGFPFRAELDHVGFWDLRIEVAQQYRRGRILIAGDACHSHPPYFGFGLNTGLEDAINLGWKLAAVLQGWGAEALLDSYEQERRPVFLDTGEVIAGQIESDRRFFERYAPQRDRAAFEAAWATEMAMPDTGPRWYEPHYEGSPVVAGAPGARSGAHGRYAFTARPGHHLAPRRLGDGSNAFDALGVGFTLLAFGADDGEVGGLTAAFARRGVPLTVVRDRFEGERLDYGSPWVLVRPDHHVAWIGDGSPRPADELVATVTGDRLARPGPSGPVPARAVP